MDDVFGGSTSEARTRELKSQFIQVGKLTTAVMNLPKCKGPAQELSILGHAYNALTRRVNLSEPKQKKYRGKIRDILQKCSFPSKALESLVGSLVYAS